MRIVYFINSVCHLGGRESITIAKANALVEIDGNEVWIMVSDNQKAPIYPLNEKVHLIHLGVNYYDTDYKGKWHVIYNMFIRTLAHKKAAREALEKVCPDVIVSTSHAEKFFLPTLKLSKRPLFVRELHVCGDYRTKAFGSSMGRMQTLVAKAKDLYDYKWRINEYDLIVTLTEEDRRVFWKNNSKVSVMPNPLTYSLPQTSDLSSKIVIMAGRINKVKNFSAAINVWKNVAHNYPDWQLHIWGDGEDKEMLQRQINDLGLQDCVKLQGYTRDLGSRYIASSIFLQTSLREGFSLVLLEAMNAGLPGVVYNCPYGPSDLIDDSKSGFLVELNDEKTLTEKLVLLIENIELRKTMGKEARTMSLRYLARPIAIRWIELFRENIAKLQM